MGRFEKNSSVVRKLTDAAMKLFFKHGIRRVSVTEICGTADVSKMSFYRHFKNKEDIAVQVIEVYFNDRIKIFDAILDADLPFEEKLNRIAAIKVEQLQLASNELIRDLMQDGDSPMGEFLKALQARQVQVIRKRFMAFQEEGHIRKDIKVDLIMYILEHLWMAFQDNKLMAVYKDKSRLQQEMFRAIYYGILPPHQRSSV